MLGPAFSMYEIQDIHFADTLLEFSCFNNRHVICFDISHRNCADEWEIVNKENGYILTHTIRSFVFNKLPAWIHSKRKVWDMEHFNNKDTWISPNACANRVTGAFSSPVSIPPGMRGRTGRFLEVIGPWLDNECYPIMLWWIEILRMQSIGLR